MSVISSCSVDVSLAVRDLTSNVQVAKNNDVFERIVESFFISAVMHRRPKSCEQLLAVYNEMHVQLLHSQDCRSLLSCMLSKTATSIIHYCFEKNSEEIDHLELRSLPFSKQTAIKKSIQNEETWIQEALEKILISKARFNTDRVMQREFEQNVNRVCPENRVILQKHFFDLEDNLIEELLKKEFALKDALLRDPEKYMCQHVATRAMREVVACVADACLDNLLEDLVITLNSIAKDRKNRSDPQYIVED